MNINLFKQQLNINQMFDKIQMILMMKMSISNNRISRLNNLHVWKIEVTASGDQICFLFIVNIEKIKIRITK